MRKLLLIIGLVLVAGVIHAQTNQTGGTTTGMTNLPTPTINQQVTVMLNALPTTGLSQEKVGVGVGTIMRNDNTFSAVTFLDYNATSNLFVRAEVDEGVTGNAIEAAAIGGGYSHTTSAARIYTFGEVRRDFANTPLSPSAKWDGIIGAGVAYAPSTNTLANFSVGAEQRMVIPINLGGGGAISPSSETVAYARYSF